MRGTCKCVARCLSHASDDHDTHKPAAAPSSCAATGAQAILSAATIPTYGLKSVEQLVAKRFPDAARVDTDLLHRSQPQLTHTWVPVEAAPELYPGPSSRAEGSAAVVGSVAFTQRCRLLERVLRPSSTAEPIPRTMVFANTAATAQVAPQSGNIPILLLCSCSASHRLDSLRFRHASAARRLTGCSPVRCSPPPSGTTAAAPGRLRPPAESRFTGSGVPQRPRAWHPRGEPPCLLQRPRADPRVHGHGCSRFPRPPSPASPCAVVLSS